MSPAEEAELRPESPEVLILDDEVDVAQEIADGLRDEGFVCAVAARGDQALRMIDAEPGRFAVLVSDIRMPGLDGLELARRLLDPARAHCPGIVLMTGHAVPAEVTTAFPAGAVQVIRKPFRWEEFLACISAARGQARPGPAADD
jgi:DNA-binding response OmpR family regulator